MQLFQTKKVAQGLREANVNGWLVRGVYVSPVNFISMQLRGIGMLVCCLGTACTHQVIRGPQPLSSSPSKHTAVNAVMSRQIANAVDAGEGDLELKTLRQRLATDSKDLNARILLARHYAKRGLPDLALEHYRLATAQFPDSVVAPLELAKTLRQMNASPEAVAVLEQASVRLPASWELISLRGIILDEAGELTNAEAAHRKAIGLDGTRAILHNNLGYNLLLQGKAEAADELKRAVQLDPQSTVARNNLASALAAGSQSKEALAEWQKSGDPAAAHNNLGAALMEQGKNAEAKEEIQAALRVHPDYAPALANLRLLAAKTGENAEIPAGRSSSWWGRMNFWSKGRKQTPVSASAKTPAKS